MTLSRERQSARMSKITNDGLTRSGTGCCIAVPLCCQTWTLLVIDGVVHAADTEWSGRLLCCA